MLKSSVQQHQTHLRPYIPHNSSRRKISKEERFAESAGGHAFSLGIYLNGCLYNLPRLRSAWIRGYRKMERDFYEQVRRSKEFIKTLPIEE